MQAKNTRNCGIRGSVKKNRKPIDNDALKNYISAQVSS